MSSSAHPHADEVQRIRVDLAAAYRLIHRLGLDDSIYTHISARLPGDGHRFLINPYGMRFEEVTPEDFDAVLDLNLRGCFFAAQAVAKAMVRDGVRGSVINVSSQMGQVAGPDRSVYCASKWAMEGWTRAMALDLAPHGIRANTLCPTFIETPLTKPFFERPGFRDWVLSNIKLGRVGQVQDLMGAVVFLASDASALMTGTSLTVDGGWTAD